MSAAPPDEARVVELFITPALTIVVEDIEDADPPA